MAQPQIITGPAAEKEAQKVLDAAGKMMKAAQEEPKEEFEAGIAVPKKELFEIFRKIVTGEIKPKAQGDPFVDDSLIDIKLSYEDDNHDLIDINLRTEITEDPVDFVLANIFVKKCVRVKK